MFNNVARTLQNTRILTGNGRGLPKFRGRACAPIFVPLLTVSPGYATGCRILGTFSMGRGSPGRVLLCNCHPILFLYFCKSHPILFLYFCKSHPYTFLVFLLKLFWFTIFTVRGGYDWLALTIWVFWLQTFSCRPTVNEAAVLQERSRGKRPSIQCT